MAPTGVDSVAMPTVHTVAVRMPAMITGIASGSSTRASCWPRRHADAARRLDQRRVDAARPVTVLRRIGSRL